jgi:hypothetical protein
MWPHPGRRPHRKTDQKGIVKCQDLKLTAKQFTAGIERMSTNGSGRFERGMIEAVTVVDEASSKEDVV